MPEISLTGLDAVCEFGVLSYVNLVTIGVVDSSGVTSGLSLNCGMLAVRKLLNFELTAVLASESRPDGRAGLTSPLDELLSCLRPELEPKLFFMSTFGFVHLVRDSLSVAEKYPFSISLGEAVTDAPPLDWRVRSGRVVSEFMV